jgi:hypothetical protein
MAQQDLEAKKTAILEKLEKAGPVGLTKGGLGVRGAKSPGARALKALEEERRVANLGTAKKTCFVLSEFYRPLEMACDRIEGNAKTAGSLRSGILELLSQKELGKGCEGEIRKKAGEALDWLVKDRKLLKLRRGRLNYYVHANPVKEALGEGEPSRIEKKEPPVSWGVLGRPEALDAYRRVKDRLGYSNVEICELQKELGAPMDQVKTFLLEENQRGNAVLSLGDWSLSSEETRSGAIELLGRPHLLVRFMDGA